MKKILLGLTILSAMAYAGEVTVVGDETSSNTVDIITTANVISSGLMIANSAQGVNPSPPTLTLSHGEINLVTGSGDIYTTEDSANFFIRRATVGEQLGREGYTIVATLNHDGILQHETYRDDDSAKINHTLTVDFTRDAGITKLANITSVIGDSKTEYTSTRQLTTNDKVIIGKVRSSIPKNQDYALVGEYTNEATLTVTISKPASTMLLELVNPVN